MALTLAKRFWFIGLLLVRYISSSCVLNRFNNVTCTFVTASMSILAVIWYFYAFIIECKDRQKKWEV